MAPITGIPGHAPTAESALPRPLPAEAFTREATYRQTRGPVGRATTLIPDAYCSPEFHRIEQQRVFAGSWIAVGTVDQVERPGQVLLAEVAERPIIVTRNRDGALRAFHNVCRHRATKLLTADCDLGRSKKIRCPYHSWTYDLDGRCLGTPLFEGSDIPRSQRGVFDTSGTVDFDKADHGLLPVRVEAWGFLVFVNLDPRATPLARHLGDLPHRFAGYRLEAWRARRRRRYDVAANYKMIAENFMEYYHLPWVHPELIHVSRLEDHHRWQGPGMYTGMCTSPVSRNSESGGWDGLAALPTLDEGDATSGRFVWLFPNTAMVVLPNHAFVLFARPAGPGHTGEEAVLLAHPESTAGVDADAGLDQLETFWDLVNRQDVEIVERVQQGIASPAYPGGRLCYRFEEPLHRFQNMIIDRMVGVDRVPEGDEETSTPMFVSGTG